jgi:hypothetical protein
MCSVIWTVARGETNRDSQYHDADDTIVDAEQVRRDDPFAGQSGARGAWRQCSSGRTAGTLS